MIELSGYESKQEESGIEQRSSSCHNVGMRENIKCENQWRAVFEAQPEGELLLPISLSKSSSNYWELCPYTGIPFQVIRELLEDSSQLSLQVSISQLQVTSRTEVQRASADSTGVSLPSPYYFEGTSSSKKEFSCIIFHYHGSDLSKDGK